MKKLLLRMTLVVVLSCAAMSQAATNYWKLDIQNMEAAWASGAAIDIVEEGVTWNFLRLPTITGVPSDTFATDPWVRLIQTDGTGGEPTDPNIVFQIFGDVTAGQWGSGGSTTLDEVHADYLFIGSAGFVAPTVTVYDWTVKDLPADTRFILTFHSMFNSARSGKFTANGGEVELNQGNTDSAILIVDSDSNGAIVGTAEAFTAEFNWAGMEIQLAQDPIITAHPKGSSASIGESVRFSVSAINPSGGELTYQWFSDPNTSIIGNETALVDGDGISGATSDTLTIAGVEEADFIWYYCEVSNTSGTATSNAVPVLLKELLYHWKLDGDGVEANGTGFEGILEAGSEFVNDGKIDGALSVDGIDGQMRIANITMTHSESITISFWVNPVDAAGDWKGMLAKWEEPSTGFDDRTFWIGQHSGNGQVNFSFYPGSEVRVVSSPVLTSGQWTHLVCTHDGSALRIYADGQLNATAQVGSGWVEKTGDLLIGNVPAGNNWFGGMIDDVQVYNYAISSEKVAQMYFDITGESTCTAPIDMDFNDDCKVDLIDFSQFAAQWMKCNWFPVSTCGN